ncbi:MAG: YbgA family protein [Bacillota bacterium]
MQEKIRVGVSSCLLGNPVRYDGGHKHNRYITDILGQYFDFVPVCPEVECRLPVPREAMHLIGDPGAPRLVTSRSGIDLTDKMLGYCHNRVKELENDDLCAFIFKKDSPSSGLYKVKVYQESGQAQKKGRGFFAAALTSHFPLLAVEEEGRLHDPGLRENFIEKVFCYYRWKTFLNQKRNYKSLIDFHTRHKLQLMSHSSKYLSKMGKMVAAGKNMPEKTLLSEYQADLMEALTLKATVKKNVNVLYHIAGHFKKLISSDEKEELIGLIDSYANHNAPLIVPLTLANHFIRKHQISYLQNQTYLEPHPSELMLRNQV